MLRKLVPLALLLMLVGCGENLDDADRDARLNRGDFRTALAERPPAAGDESDSPPDFLPISPPAVTDKSAKLVSLDLDGSEPTRDVFMELANKADLDLDMEASLNPPPVVLTAHDQPLPDIIERVADKAGVRATIKHGILCVDADTPYLQTYRVDYPNIARLTTSSISSSLNIASATESQNNRNDSAAATEAKSAADFWAELAASLSQILDIDGPSAAPASKTATSFSINKQAGLVSVRGTARQQRMVADWLDTLQQAAQSQVLIEARILEVNLSDAFSSGINWNTLFGGGFELGLVTPAGTPSVRLDPVPSTSPGLNLNVTNNDFQGLFNFLQTFGTVRALSSPRMTVMQNQTGTIKVVRNEVYFRLTIQETDATANSPSRRDVTSEQRTIPVGLIMNVQPSIDRATGRVTLALRPTITRIADRRTDPGILIAASDAGLSPSQVDSTVPIVAVQEMDSVVSLQSGQALVMGGLMRDETTSTTEGIPGTADVPLVKYLANSRDDNTSKAELVVFLKATIVNQPDATIHPTDRDLYDQLGHDPRAIDATPASEKHRKHRKPVPVPGNNLDFIDPTGENQP